MIEYRIGDVFDRLAEIPDGSIDLIVTSPPFLALRSYLPADHPDKAKEIGSEPTPAEFLDTLYALSAEWGRVLAPHGSICVELGDTYSGSGGAGGDYNPGGLREGQDKFDGSNSRRGRVVDHDSGRRNPGPGWPLAKSLTGIPTLYPWGLAYGRNLLTGQPHDAGQWRIRNLIVWARPNPPVGALGDKFRPATSYITVACKGQRRYFDLDAVRLPSSPNTHARLAQGADPRPTSGKKADNPNNNFGSMNEVETAGAPPLDWHADDHPEDGDWLWKLSTQPYKGSHYATYPLTLPKRLIEAMCPLRVCTVCGKPSERIVGEAEYVSDRAHGLNPPSRGKSVAGTTKGSNEGVKRLAPTLGWTDCGHGSYRCRCCNVLVPLDHALRRSREGQRSEAPVSQEGVLVEPVEGASGQASSSADMPGVRGGVPRPNRELAGVQSELFGEVGPHGGQGQHVSGRAALTELEGRSEANGGRVHPDLGAGRHAGPTEERLHDGASSGDAGASRSTVGTVGDRPPPQRGQGRQPDRESGSGDTGTPCGNGDVPELSASLPGELNDGYVCPCGSRDVEYVADHWRTGIVLDPFAGSGTTLEAAQAVGRHAIGIDLDSRNADLARERVGMFLEIKDTAA